MKNKIYGLKYVEKETKKTIQGGSWYNKVEATRSYTLTGGPFGQPDDQSDNDFEWNGLVVGW